MTLKRVLFGVVSALLIASCSDRIPNNNTARILAMGDSFLAWQSSEGAAIPDYLEQELGEMVINRSVTGSYMTRSLSIGGGLGIDIPRQYKASDWKWVILSGGGNDLRFGCGCRSCDEKLDNLISVDGTSAAIPELVQKIRAGGAQVIYIGYIPSPGVISPVDICENEAIELEKRLTRMASADPGVYFISNADLVPFGDRSFHAEDMIHPSEKARRDITERVANIILR